MTMIQTLLLIAVAVLVGILLIRFFVARRSESERAEREARAQAAREAERQAADNAARQAAAAAARRLAERQATEKAEREAAEAAARREAERQAAQREADRLAIEKALHEEENERQAIETAIEHETQRQAAEEAQRRSLAASAAALVPKIKAEEQTVVMIADDSKVVRVKTSRLLTAHRYQVLMAEDGLDAARQIEVSTPDVLVTDEDMPGMNGLQLARQLRANPRTARLPIILVTSDNEQLRANAAAAGVDVVLGKPYPEEQLISHIQQLLRNQANA
ncbi:MAG: response regulator [Candidatus Accumulibacter sp.]|uniref:response regulator n=1 Tax=Accumulibacter sp. TaxID=2053492 RepID=UPI001B29F083|nr:response regulator [Accumulibacter sp.]MBO3709802.1 response regulator [Accumulibacter sp.]